MANPPAHQPNITVPPGTPDWIDSELISLTLETWQPYYQKPLTVDEAIDMIRSVGRLYHTFASKADS